MPVFSGITGFINQYVIYILGTVILSLVVICGMQHLRLVMLQKDLLVAQELVKNKETLLAINKSAMDQLKTDSDSLRQRVELSGLEIQKIERKHAEDLKKILTDNVLADDANCDDVAKWARDIARRK